MVGVIWDLTPSEIHGVLGRYGAGQGELGADREVCLRHLRSAGLSCPGLVGPGTGRLDEVSWALERFGDRLAARAAGAEGRAGASRDGAATATAIYQHGDGELEANADRRTVTGPAPDAPR